MSADSLHQQCEFKLVKLDETLSLKNGFFSGYASLFNQVDLGNDQINKGAFSRSLKSRNTKNIRMLYQHHPDEPIGTWHDIREDQKGLFVKGAINLKVARGREIYALMQSGAIDGLSIGYKIIKAKKDKYTRIRHIIEADLWEISIVTFPMLPQARIEQVSAEHQQTKTMSNFHASRQKIAKAHLLTKLNSAKYLFTT